METSDKEGLPWKSKLIVTTAGIVVKLFERFVNSEKLMNDYFVSCSSSHVALLSLKTLKSVVHDMK